MKQYDMRNISKRAYKLLDEHMNMLDAVEKPFLPMDGSYYQEEEDGQTYFKVGYKEHNKFLTRSYNMELKKVIGEIDFPWDFKGKIRFSGLKEINGAVFVPDKEWEPLGRSAGSKLSSEEKGLKMLNAPGLMKQIAVLARQVEVSAVRVKYTSRARTLEVSVIPYSGAYIWVKFPPAFYSLRLKKEEMNHLYRLAELIADYLKTASLGSGIGAESQ